MGKKQKEELPDYTVANMDVDGMPWNSRRPWQIFPGDPSKSRKEFDVKVPEPGMENEVPDDPSFSAGSIWLQYFVRNTAAWSRNEHHGSGRFHCIQ